jgi:L-iditol 2-dehydrogenase
MWAATDARARMLAILCPVNRAAVLHAPGDLRIEERPVPQPGPREVLVEIAAVGVCGSDVHYYEHGRIGSHVVRAPMVLGHESAGRVVGLGPGVQRHAVGDRVTLEPGVPCGRCRECRAGRYNLCRDVRFFATPPIDGAFANYVTIHEDFAFALPDSVSDEAGALMEPLSVGIWACRKGGVAPGDRVLVTGAGPIGLLAQQCALAFGATSVTITDVSEERLELARRTGATRAVRAGEDLDEADALIECSGHPAALAAGIAAVRPAGTAVVVGMGPEEDATVPLSLIQNREIWLTGTFRYANTYPTAIALVASGRVDPEAIITGRYGLGDAEAALRAGRDDPANVKAMVVPRR